MDSPDSPPTAPATQTGLAPGALARLGRTLPGVSAIVRFSYRTAVASAVAAAVIVATAIYETAGGFPTPGVVSWGAAAVTLAVLWIPAAAAALVGWTLSDLVRLPGDLRAAALEASGRVRSLGAAESRVGGSLRALWAARGLAAESRGAWLKAVGAVRFVRLASLPFALTLLGLFALNAVVIGAGVVALLILLF